jgi:precorrin-2 methylase
LGELEMEKHAILVSRCGMDGEKVEYNIDRAVGEKLPYMSLLIVKKNNGFEPH